MLATSQLDEGLKTELTIRLYDDLDEGTAIVSSNCHQDHFGLAFGLSTVDGAVAHSACVGFGMERIALALVRSMDRSGVLARRSSSEHGLARVNPSEVATYFGPSTSPLFGVLHLPEDNRIRGGVIICSSLGREAMDSARLQRPLADGLARRGFAVLRFDYLGTGDSAFAQDRDDAVDLWRRSIGYALEYVGEVGAHSVTAIALRAGGLILSNVLAESPSVDRVVYFDPVGTGRRYLREQTALATMSIGPNASPADTVAITGARLSARAAKALSALSLSIAPRAGVDHLLVTRSGLTDTKVTALADVDQVRSVTAGGLTEFAQIAETLTPLPLPAIDTMINWIDESVLPVWTPAVPRYLTSVEMPAERPSQTHTVIESIESIGPDALFAIRTRPEHAVPGEGDVVLFYSTAYDLHTGPMREWVEFIPTHRNGVRAGPGQD